MSAVTGQYIGAIDQGTRGTQCLLFDENADIVAHTHVLHESITPQEGWFEHDPAVIWEDTKEALTEALSTASLEPDSLTALGITNQRETTVLWEKETGDPVGNALCWRDRRTEDELETLTATSKETIRERTGLPVDAYFSAPKIAWLLDNAGENLRERARNGELLAGTIDSWLLYNLTGEHATDVTNASRTMLFDIHDCAWDESLCALFDIPPAILPTVRPSAATAPHGRTDPEGFLGGSVPVTAMLGDQQAAMLGQDCFEPGTLKNTYGTGSFALLNTGEEAVHSTHGLLTTVAFQLPGEPVQYALEGAVFVTGGAIEWLEELGLIENLGETAPLVQSVDSTNGVYLVPAFAGLGSPHWDRRARGTFLGLTRDTERAHLVRAAVESTAYQTREIIEAMAADTGQEIAELRVDGAATRNNLFCQLQADLTQTAIRRPAGRQTTALGVAYAAGLAAGYWEDLAEIRATRSRGKVFRPAMDEQESTRRFEQWERAVSRAREWE